MMDVVPTGRDGRNEILTQRYQREPSPSVVPERVHAVRDDEMTCESSSAATSDDGSGSTHTSQAGEEEQEEEEEEGSCTVASSESEERLASPPPHLPSSPVTPHTPHMMSSRQRRDLVSKYLQHENGNGRMGTGDPARMIENKLNLLIQECCECRVSQIFCGLF